MFDSVFLDGQPLSRVERPAADKQSLGDWYTKAPALSLGSALASTFCCQRGDRRGAGVEVDVADPHDLRYSPMIVSKEAFRAVVKDGVLKLNGMPPALHLKDEELELIRYYLRGRAQQTRTDLAQSKVGSAEAKISVGDVASGNWSSTTLEFFSVTTTLTQDLSDWSHHRLH